MKTVKTKKGTELPLMDIKGNDYLQVAYRLVWFREEHPDWSICSEIIERNQDFCLAKASILDVSGRIISEAFKYEDKRGFPDFIEKSTTGAIGRALALCGYGTQFTDDLDEGERLADAPTPAPQRMSDRVKNMNPQLKEALQKAPPKDDIPFPDQEFEGDKKTTPVIFEKFTSPAQGATITFGKNKGKLLTELSEKQLGWYAENYEQNAMNPDKQRFAAENSEMAALCRAELAYRETAGPPKIDMTEQIPF